MPRIAERDVNLESLIESHSVAVSVNVNQNAIALYHDAVLMRCTDACVLRIGLH